MLYAGLDLGYWSEDVFTALQTQTREVTRLLARWIVSIEERGNSPAQFREDGVDWDPQSPPALSTEH
jgi:hypothetical protein